MKRHVEHIFTNTCSKALAAVVLCCLVLAGFMTSPSYACGDNWCCAKDAQKETRDLISDEHDETREHITTEFNNLKAWFSVEVWPKYLIPAWMMITEQVTVTGVQQVAMIGTMLDAKQQMEAQRLIQRLQAETHKDYHPSVGMCVIGTNIRSLAQSQRQSEHTTFVLSQRSLDRQMGTIDTSAAQGNFTNKQDRLLVFRDRFCDVNDNAKRIAPGMVEAGFEAVCIDSGPIITRNRDIDFTQTIARSHTLDIDFTDTARSTDEDSVFALGNNLYAHNVIFRIPETVFVNRDNRDEVLDFRSLIAKRSVAEHSFNTIIGLKSKSGAGVIDKTSPYIKRLMMTLDFEEKDIDYYMGKVTVDGEKDLRPSYDMQMKILTQKMFQSPDFYTNLYDKPANVDRKGVALQAIELMQNFDIWKSHLRTEAMLSVMLEMEIIKLQDKVQNSIDKL